MSVAFPDGLVGDYAYVAIDTETTGLNVTDRPLEIAGVRIEGGQITDSFQSLVQPGIPVPQASFEVHGLDDATLADAPTPQAVLPQLAKFGQGAIWLAHNSGYDAGILGMAYLRAGLPAPVEPVIDTCRLARSCIPGQRTYRLETLGRLLGLAEDGYHRALADAQVAAGLFLECVRRLGGDTPMRELTRRAGGWLSVAGVADAAERVPEGFEELTEAVHSGRLVELQYDAGGKGKPSSVRVAPKVIYRGNDRAYMEAFCFDGRYVKSYRLDRISSYRVL